MEMEENKHGRRCRRLPSCLGSSEIIIWVLFHRYWSASACLLAYSLAGCAVLRCAAIAMMMMIFPASTNERINEFFALLFAYSTEREKDWFFNQERKIYINCTWFFQQIYLSIHRCCLLACYCLYCFASRAIIETTTNQSRDHNGKTPIIY